MIIITGMHRTGTSAIANMLYELGLDFGDPSEFITADRWNVEGYFENKEVTFLNDDIILGEFAPSRQYWTTPGQNRNLSLKIFMALSRMRYFYILLAGRTEVKTISRSSAPIRSAICRRAFSTASSASQP